MIILISGASHTGKTYLAQKLMEKCNYPYLSIDHIKMGLIRSGNTSLTPLSDDEALTAYLWPVVREIIKTAIENKQNLIVEGCYVPFDWKNDFDLEYQQNIKHCCLIMSQNYIKDRFEDIKKYANVVENRICDDYTVETALKENENALNLAAKYDVDYLIIDKEYNIESMVERCVSDMASWQNQEGGKL